MYIKFGDYGCYHYLCTTKQRDLAQLVAHTSGGREVAGSSPVIPTCWRKRKSSNGFLFFFVRFFAPYSSFLNCFSSYVCTLSLLTRRPQHTLYDGRGTRHTAVAI